MQKKSLNTEARRKKRNAFNQFDFVVEGDLNSVLLVVEGLELIEDDFLTSQFEEVGNKQVEVLSKVGPVDSEEGAVILDLSSQMVQSTFSEVDIGK